MLILHLIMGLNGDDIRFAKVLTNQTLFDFIQYRYYNWSSRVIIDALLVILARQNLIIWKIVDIIIYTFGVCCIIKLVNVKYSKKMAFLGILLFLMYPFYEMASAGWISTTLNYSWCFAFGVISFMPLIYETRGEKASPLIYAVSILALIYATNQEQSAALIFAFNILYLVNCWIKAKAINRYNLFATVISAAALIYIFTCPGNTLRFAHEVAYWYPDFNTLPIIYKSYLGLVTTFGTLIEQKIIFSIFYILLNVCAWLKTKNRYLKYIFLFNIFLIVFITVFVSFIDLANLSASIKSFASLANIVEKSQLMGVLKIFKQITAGFPFITQTLSLFTYQGIPVFTISSFSVVIISLYLFISSSIMLVMVFPKNLLALFIFVGGFISRFIVGFSPVIFPSGARVTIFLYVALITLTLMLIKKMYDENSLSARWRSVLEKTFMSIAFLNCMIVFVIIFVKYSIF